ncbi:hypothetical protein ACJMK2_040588 [Sinanodonta woodiana]|uniref:THAP-type domain-containing protein n=1 Tax=Sinanodonta woodiana TaxID=1069815 RepID=A0ABD3W1H0_SINWO
MGYRNQNKMGKNLQKMWLSALKRNKPDGKSWEQIKHSAICADHFNTGKPQEYPDHPDYVPSVFEFYLKKIQQIYSKNKMLRYENKLKQKTEFESTEASSMKVKESPQKLNTAVQGSLTPTQQTPQKNTCSTFSV